MSVIDASVLVDALAVLGRSGDAARGELARHSVVEVPAIFGAEAVSALRHMAMARRLSPERAAAAVQQVKQVRAIRFPFEPFADRVWELRAGLTTYDAWYVALAERLGSELVTADATLSRASGLRCVVRLLR